MKSSVLNVIKKIARILWIPTLSVLFVVTYLAVFSSFFHPPANYKLIYQEKSEFDDAKKYNFTLPPQGFLIKNEGCRILQVEIFTNTILSIYKPKKPFHCPVKKPLLRKSYDEKRQRYILSLDLQHEQKYLKTEESMWCCYKEIIRDDSRDEPDKHIKLKKCQIFFPQKFLVPIHVNNGILVYCYSAEGNDKLVYQDAFFFVQQQPRESRRTESYKNFENISLTAKSFNGIHLFGIDSMSQFNFRRTMPKSFHYLQQMGWFELSAYNKIDENTFPNWMALLAGLNSDETIMHCKPNFIGGLDKCPTLFKLFQEHGYVTGYFEDQTMISTFEYGKKGFKHPPIDHFITPFLFAAKSNLPAVESPTKVGQFCLGSRSSPDYIYKEALLEFAVRYRNRPSFSLSWTNTFSHDDFQDPSGMDESMLQYLELFEKHGVFKDNIMIFFSDHGMRYGALRRLPEGYIEERLPMFFIWLPQRFRQQHPEFVACLHVNRHRLTTPFDIHMTLEQLLALSLGVNSETMFLTSSPNLSCTTAQTIFRPISESRSCQEACIPNRWCACIPYVDMDKTSSKTIAITKLVISKINEFLRVNEAAQWGCGSLSLFKLKEAYRKTNNYKYLPRSTRIQAAEDHFGKESMDTEVQLYLIFIVMPGKQWFDATFLYNFHFDRININVSRDINRLDTWSRTSKCTPTESLKKFCICPVTARSGVCGHAEMCFALLFVGLSLLRLVV